MAKKTKSLEDWCLDEGNNALLFEWDVEKNKAIRFHSHPSEIDYNSPLSVWWKCHNGHEWESPVAARTMYKRICPVCDPKQISLPIGTKRGCLTIIGGFDEYQMEIAQKEVSCLEKDRADFLQSKRKPNSNVDSVDFFDGLINDHKSRQYYKCQCSCGQIQYMDEFHFLEKKHRYCSGIDYRTMILDGSEYPAFSECGLKKDQDTKRLKTYSREYDESYHVDYLNTVHESLEVIECVNDHYEMPHRQGDKRRRGSGIYRIYKVYRCRCYLCGKEKEIISSKFTIHAPTAYGYRACGGYYCEAFCDCHKISSFQWIVTKILTEYKVPYRVEYSFSDLFGIRHVKLLRYDFAIFNADGSIKCLIECQGEQHYEAVEEFGGTTQLEAQKKNDELKRKYATEHGIPLYEIPYTNKKYEKVKEYLKSKSII